MPNHTMLYKCPGPHEIHGGHFDYTIVDADDFDALATAQADGWFPTTPEAKAAYEAEKAKPESDDAPPTREELKAKADELGIEYAKNISDKKLSELIDAYLDKG